MKTLEEARIIARTSDPDWVGEELFRLQEQAAHLGILEAKAYETLGRLQREYMARGDELAVLRARVAELEALNKAAARACDALEGMQIETMAGLVEVWRSGMSDEQRLELATQCCHGCGSLDTGCQCQNDE